MMYCERSGVVANVGVWLCAPSSERSSVPKPEDPRTSSPSSRPPPADPRAAERDFYSEAAPSERIAAAVLAELKELEKGPVPYLTNAGAITAVQLASGSPRSTPSPTGRSPATRRRCACSPAPRDAGWMQHVAREMNLAETAFLVRRADGFDLRWFTPAVEVDLCGHATLASAHVLWEEGHLEPAETARFHTRSGLLTASRHGELDRARLPRHAGRPADCRPSSRARLGAPMRLRGPQPVRLPGGARLRGRGARRWRPTWRACSRLGGPRRHRHRPRRTTPAYDFVSRFFAPGVGIDEDPVTGSAHCAWARSGRRAWARRSWSAIRRRRAAATVRVRAGGRPGAPRAARRSTVLRGELLH